MIDSLWENPLFNICFLAGSIFIFAGLLMYYFPPKNINALYGYRTRSSMKNLERWNFAQKFSAKAMMKLGTFLLLSSLVPLISDFSTSLNLIIGLSATIGGVAILFIIVEKAIKSKFSP